MQITVLKQTTERVAKNIDFPFYYSYQIESEYGLIDVLGMMDKWRHVTIESNGVFIHINKLCGQTLTEEAYNNECPKKDFEEELNNLKRLTESLQNK